MTRLAVWVLGLLLLASAGLSWAGWEGAGDAGTVGAAVQVGAPAPDFQLPRLDGGSVHLADLRGRPVLLNFWATWCPPCREEMPEIQRFAQESAGRITIVGVDEGEPAETVSRFVKEHGFGWTFALDRRGDLLGPYGLRFYPTSLWIDPRGVVRRVVTGPMTLALMESYLRELVPG